jgi:hypothetical protein
MTGFVVDKLKRRRRRRSRRQLFYAAVSTAARLQA